VSAAILRAFAKNPVARFPSMGVLAETLEPFAKGTQLSNARRASPPKGAVVAPGVDPEGRTVPAVRGVGIPIEKRVDSKASATRRRVLLASGVLLVAAAAATALRVRFETGGTRAEPTRSERSSEVPNPTDRALTSVSVVFSPIDGEVFRDGISLGGMPVSIHLARNETAQVEIRREGFYPKRVTLDGTRPVIVVQLVPIPGVVPMVPVPSASPLEQVRRTSPLR
jgi:hypothetical protein